MIDKKITTDDISRVFSEWNADKRDGRRRFSVLVPVYEKNGELYVLYELRSPKLARQPGEICFPGGELEDGETMAQCALRETFEEIGIPENKIKLLNRLITMEMHSGPIMEAYVGIVDPDAIDNLDISEREVAEVFSISVQKLINHEAEIYTTEYTIKVPEDFPYDRVNGGKPYNWANIKGTVPIYDIDGWPIWGLTGRVTRAFVEALKTDLNLQEVEHV